MPDGPTLELLAAALNQVANSAASVDELVKEAEIWLHDHGHLLPGDRVLRDAARAAFASADATSLATERQELTEA